MADTRVSAGTRRRRRLSHAIAALVFLAASAVVYFDLFREPRATVAVTTTEGAFRATRRADATFESWLVARNARTLATRPHRMFDAEHCAPAENTLTLGIPMLTQGVLAMPASAVSREPVLVYNLSIVLLGLVSAFAMYALVARWSGVPEAGLVAGLLFGFQPLRLGHIMHPSVWDISWTVLAFFFAERLFAHGRWRDALLLGAAIALQIGASFYPLIAATLLAPCVLGWLLVRYGVAKVGPARLAAIAGIAIAAAAAVLGPYLFAETAGGGLERARFHYLQWPLLADPSSVFFPGWTLLALVAVSLLAGRRGAAAGIQGDPRWALLAGAVLAALVAAGSNTRMLVAVIGSPELSGWVPNFHTALAAVVPGLDAVRGISRLSAGSHAALTVIAGLGAGAVIRAAGSRGVLVATLLVAVAAFDVLRAPSLGLERRYQWTLEAVRPDDDAIAFFAELERRGNRGPLLELPLDAGAFKIASSPGRILLSAWHRRRTSACFGSYEAAGRKQLAERVAELPRPAAIHALAEQGFTTLVVHLDPGRPGAVRIAGDLERAAAVLPELVPLHATPRRAAYRLESAPSGSSPR